MEQGADGGGWDEVALLSGEKWRSLHEVFMKSSCFFGLQGFGPSPRRWMDSRPAAPCQRRPANHPNVGDALQRPKPGVPVGTLMLLKPGAWQMLSAQPLGAAG